MGSGVLLALLSPNQKRSTKHQLAMYAHDALFQISSYTDDCVCMNFDLPVLLLLDQIKPIEQLVPVN